MRTKRRSTSEDGGLLSVPEAARVLNVRPGQVYRLVELGRLPHIRIGKYIRFSPDLVEQLMRGGDKGGPET